MSEFRVGDPVRVKGFLGSKEKAKLFIGKQGTVIDELHLATRTHMVRIDIEPEHINTKRRKEFLFFPEELEPIE